MPSGELNFAPRRFSTTTVPEQKRVEFWREMFGREAVRLDIESRSNDPFRAEAVMRALPGLRSTSFASSPAHLERPKSLIRDADDAVVLLVSQKGILAASQRGRAVSLHSGDATLLLHGEPSAVTHGHIRFQGLIVPRAPVAELVTNVEDAAIRPVPRDNATLRLLMGYLKIISRDLAIGQPDL